MSDMQQVSIGAKEGLYDYLKEAKTHFVEDTIASAESITVMDNYLEVWYKFHLFVFDSVKASLFVYILSSHIMFV